MVSSDAVLRLLVALTIILDISPEELYLNYLDGEKCQKYYDRLLTLINGSAEAA